VAKRTPARVLWVVGAGIVALVAWSPLLAKVGAGDDPPAFVPARLEKASVVLRVKLIKTLAADKYAWFRVRVLKTFKNATGRRVGETLDVAALSWNPGVPPEECTVYLEPYNVSTGKGPPWKLLGGGADEGVSHVLGADGLSTSVTPGL
jgi:hypothetical protein